MSAVSVQNGRPTRRIGAWTLQGILAAAFLAVVAGAIALGGLPAPPAPGRQAAGSATVAGLGAVGDEPAFAALEQATAAARVMMAQSERTVAVLTAAVASRTVTKAHGR